MSTLSVTTINTANSTTDLTLKTGNTSGPEIVLAANGSTLFNNFSTLSVGNSTVNTAITSTGITQSAHLLTGNVTPTAIAANTDNWNPGITGIYQVRTSANTDGNINYNITGLDGGSNGQIVTIQNIGVGALILKNRSADSSSENQFALPDDIRLDGEQSIQLYYDGNDTKWRLLHSIDVPYFHKVHLTKGFFSGGETASNQATADRTTYSTETTAAVTGANLSQARRALAAAGNAEKGFFSGGFTGSNQVTADRTTYSTETTAAVSGANLSQARRDLAAAGNAEKGFFSGGYTGSNQVTADRTTYSTETTAAVTGANLSQARRSLAAAGNVEKGFFSGGITGSIVATADRTTYSTETTAAVTGANLAQARRLLAAAGNAEKGFFSGGDTGSAVATADRTTYSTETTAAVSGANLSQARYQLAAAGNAEKGFFSGGYTGSYVATADRTTYSTETTAAVSGANLSQARRDLAAI